MYDDKLGRFGVLLTCYTSLALLENVSKRDLSLRYLRIVTTIHKEEQFRSRHYTGYHGRRVSLYLLSCSLDCMNS